MNKLFITCEDKPTKSNPSFFCIMTELMLLEL